MPIVALVLLALGPLDLFGLGLAHARRQGHERKDPALAVVVGAHDVQDVLHRNYQGDGPEEKREQTEDVLGQGLHAVGKRHALFKRVERRSANVSVDHPKRAQG